MSKIYVLVLQQIGVYKEPLLCQEEQIEVG